MSVLVIAELGINHDGNFEKALHMIDEAIYAGADIVKFQHYDAAKLLGKDSPYYEYANKCQFTKEDHEALYAYCVLNGIEYMVSVFDVDDIPWADKLCKRHKIASRMNKNEDFIREMIRTGKQIIMSTQETKPFPIPNVDYMYCITKYPTPLKEMKKLPCNPELGLSSHCPSIQPTLKAVQQGAQIIEHHVTFSRSDEGCDHSSSITFDELKMLVDCVKSLLWKSN